MWTITSRKDLKRAIRKELQEKDMSIEELYKKIYNKYNVKFEFTKQLLTYHVRSIAIPVAIGTNSYKHDVTIYKLGGDHVRERSED